jgi:hypothetical protein
MIHMVPITLLNIQKEFLFINEVVNMDDYQLILKIYKYIYIYIYIYISIPICIL